MTTLIDRITKRIDELKKSTCTKSIVDELERVKAELTAVNGVYELIMDGLKRLHRNSETQQHECSQEGYEYGLEDAMKLVEEIQKSLKQTSVASEEDCAMRDKYGDIIGVKDSQPKECEGCKEKTRIINDLQQKLCAEYGIR